MKSKRIIGIIIASLIIFATICMLYPNNTYAGNASYVLGITNIRESGYGYGVGGLKSDKTPNKKVWKIVSYNNNVISYANAFYCIKAEHGFVDNTDNANKDVSTIRKTYDTRFDMKTASSEVISRLNTINTAIGDTQMTSDTYNKILWILDNMYLPKVATAQTDKTNLGKAAGINAGNLLLTDDELEVIQQLAIWRYTNPNDSNYNKAQTIYRNRTISQDNNYASLADIFDDPVLDNRAGQVRQAQANAIYNYLVTEAAKHPNYLSEPVNTVPITLNSSNLKAVEENGTIYVGPLNITVDSTRQYNINELAFKDNNGNVINLTGTNKLLNSNKEVVPSGNIIDVIGQDFYISLPSSTSIKAVSISIKGTYPTTTATYYTTSQSTYAQEQPVVLVERGNKDISLSAQIALPSKINIDLSLRKFITGLNSDGVEQEITNRIPSVDTSTINSVTGGTARYNHTKQPVPVKIGDIVTYTIRVYNEGKVNGYVSEITDHLPSYLEYISSTNATTDAEKAAAKFNENFLWEVSSDGRTIKTGLTAQNKSDTYAILTGIQRENTLLKAFNGGTTLDYIDVKVKCRVRSTAQAGTKITNIADITGMQDETGSNVTIDRDSQVGNVQLPDDSSLPNYKDSEISSKIQYIPGQQDDDDFEKLTVKVFDLALRKFITAVDEGNVTTRVPSLSMGADGNIKYTHTKEPVEVQNGNIVTYTLRIYNEGDINGYASEITDDLPEGLEYIPENNINKTYRWKMIDEAGNETTDLTKAVKVTTDYLSKEQETTSGANLLKAFNKETGITGSNPDYRDIKIAFKVIEPNSSTRILTNIAQISDDSDPSGNPIDDIDSTPGNSKMDEDDIDVEHVKLYEEKFDLALRKFITAVDNKSITTRIPVVSKGGNGNIKYTHTKEPVEVQNGNIVTYTLRIYNEGDINGYASEITDDLPEGLEYIPDNYLNKIYRWKMIDKDGKETTDLTKAVKVTTDYLSKEQEETDGGNLLKAFNRNIGITGSNPDYKDIKIAFKVIEPNTSDRILTNIAQISDDSDENGNPVDDVDSTPGNSKMDEDDIDVEHIKLVYFDLALRKFITRVDNLDVNNRYPQLTVGEDGNIKYTHTKEPVEVENGNTVTYTLRVYNEGKIAGYASEVTDDLPEGLEYLPENELNKTYRWKMIDKDGKETTELAKAEKITTDYLSKEQEKEAGENLIKAFNKNSGITDSNPDYRDVKIAFKVTEPNTSDRILINTAEISQDTDKDGNPVEDIDSTPGNNKPDEDDIDIEKVKVKYFDLSLKKWVTKVYIIEDGKQTVTDTKHTGDENPEPVVKVDLKDKKVNKVTVKFGYKIKVTNEGQIEGCAKEVKDYIPDGLKFVAEDNPTWKKLNDKEVVTDKLANTLLKPGESGTVDIILTWENSESNLGLKVNTAEISKDYNKSNTPDIDSTPNNKKPGEDDIDDAPVILSIKTGEIRVYIVLTTIVLITTAGGVYLIKKYVL